jgi:hypothetical protein
MSPGYLLNYGSCRQRMRGTATAVSTGCYASVSTENYALAVSTGNYALAVSTENYALAVSTENYALAVSTENYALAVSAGNYAPTAGGLTTSTSTAFCRLVGLTVSSFPASERNDFELAIQATLVSATRRCT